MNKDDYFSTAEMKLLGPEIWQRVRDKLRKMGNPVVEGYGMFTLSVNGRHFIVMSAQGNLVHVKEKPKGLCMSIAKFLGLGQVKAFKIETGDCKETIEQAINHLVDLGYSDVNRKAIMTGPGCLIGIVADTDGVIYSVCTRECFDVRYANIEEIVFDTATKLVLSNFRPKRKIINVLGVDVFEDDLMNALVSLSVKSTT